MSTHFPAVLPAARANTSVLQLPAAMEGTTQLGYPQGMMFPIGIALLVSVVVYLIPRTSIS